MEIYVEESKYHIFRGAKLRDFLVICKPQKYLNILTGKERVIDENGFELHIFSELYDNKKIKFI